jgi:hypothetical protein
VSACLRAGMLSMPTRYVIYGQWCHKDFYSLVVQAKESVSDWSSQAEGDKEKEEYSVNLIQLLFQIYWCI